MIQWEMGNGEMGRWEDVKIIGKGIIVMLKAKGL
jgi:hypothetical protein